MSRSHRLWVAVAAVVTIVGAIALGFLATGHLERAYYISQIITSVALAVGVGMGAYQLSASRRANQLGAVRTLTEDLYRFGESLISQPNLYPYFYENAVPKTVELRRTVQLVAENRCDVISTILLRKKVIPESVMGEGLDIATWIRDVFAGSPAMREHVQNHPRWYDNLLNDFISPE